MQEESLCIKIFQRLFENNAHWQEGTDVVYISGTLRRDWRDGRGTERVTGR